MGHQFKSLGSCGGAGSSATPGGYNQGAQFAASTGAGKPEGVTSKDVRGGNAKAGGYNQGPTLTAKVK